MFAVTIMTCAALGAAAWGVCQRRARRVWQDKYREIERTAGDLRTALRQSEDGAQTVRNMLRAANETCTERAAQIHRLTAENETLRARENRMKGPVQPSPIEILAHDLRNLFAYNGTAQGQYALGEDAPPSGDA